ncbi:FUSC family protein [Isoptericola sp. NPDC019693]|uniref:FUSC family protein n=1 Tax=Isoptericola sp. NPDC019693 TaxID=3364009 RepID=UPI003787FFF2
MPPLPVSSPVKSSVRSSARDVLDPAHLRAALRVNPADATVAAALRCGAAVALALAACAALGRPDLAGFAALGALTSLYGRYEPYRRRAALVAGAAVFLVGSFVITAALTTAGAPLPLTLVVVALIASAATVACLLVRTGPPGATIVVFTAAGGLAAPPVWGTVAAQALACAAGAALAWAVAMSGYLARPSGPARLAVRRAADAVRRAVAPGAPEAAVPAARAAVARAEAVLADDLSHRRTRDTARVLAADLAQIAARLDPPAGAGTDTGAEPGPGTAATAGPAAALAPRERLRDTARATWHAQPWRLASARVAISSLVAGAVALVAGLGHPAWAQMGATATLQGSTTHHAVVRALQRAGGTALGALLAWPLLAAHLSFAATCVLVVALQVVTEIVVGRHYGLAMLTITPMALLMTSLGGAADPAGMAASRALDTVLGAALGVLAVVLVHPRRRPAAPAAA